MAYIDRKYFPSAFDLGGDEDMADRFLNSYRAPIVDTGVKQSRAYPPINNSGKQQQMGNPSSGMSGMSTGATMIAAGGFAWVVWMLLSKRMGM